MNIERELRLINFLYHLKANPGKVQGLAIEYYARYLEQQEQLRNLSQNYHDLEKSCQELEAEKKELCADYEVLRMALEEEQKKKPNSTTGNRDCNSTQRLVLTDFAPLSSHNFFQS